MDFNVKVAVIWLKIINIGIQFCLSHHFLTSDLNRKLILNLKSWLKVNYVMIIFWSNRRSLNFKAEVFYTANMLMFCGMIFVQSPFPTFLLADKIEIECFYHALYVFLSVCELLPILKFTFLTNCFSLFGFRMYQIVKLIGSDSFH